MLNTTGTTASSQSCMGILLVEDDPDIRETVRDLLVDEGYQVQTAVNGREGIEVLSNRQKPCLILLDMMMPVLDGSGFLKELRERQLHDVPVVVVSAIAHRSEPGTVGFIRKPVDLDALLSLVERYCLPPPTLPV
jgi:CheY-like chemotaxis protein